jgi:LuxR family transcriptional regulator, maltose regulon positive regulatory protein
MGLAATPRLPRDLLDRPRLRDALARDRALVVLRAPAGFGKTVALAQWAQRVDVAGVWFRPLEGAADPVPFAVQLAEELRDAGLLDERNPLRSAAEAVLAGTGVWDLLRRGLRAIAAPVQLVVDESDRLSDETLTGLLGLLVDVPTLAVRAATRRSSPLTEPGLGVVLDVAVVDAAELAFTRAETAALLGAADGAEVDRVARETRGVPLLVRLLARDDGAGGADAARSVDSLLRLRRPSWEPGFGGFLERIAVADTVDVALAARLTGAADPQSSLDLAEREGLGLWIPADGVDDTPGDAVFALSPLVRESLARSLDADPAERIRLSLVVARWELQRGRPFPALRRAVDARDWDLVSDIVREHWYALFGFASQVRDLFARVPVAALRHQPIVSMLLAILYNAVGSRRVRALEFFALAAYGARIRRADAPAAERVLLRAIETAAHRVSGRIGPARRTALDALATLRAMSPAERQGLGRNESSVYNQAGLSLLYAGDVDDAQDCFRHSLAIGDVRGLLGLAMETGVHAIQGDMPEARAGIADAATRLWPDGWLDGYFGSFLVLARADLALEEYDAGAAERILRPLAPHRPTIEHWAPLLQVETTIDLLRGRVDAARSRIESTLRRQSARQSGPGLAADDLRFTRALVELAAGDVRAAEQHLARTRPGPARAVALARVALVQADPDAALAQLQQGDAIASASSRIRAEHQALLAAALSLVDEAAPGGADVSLDVPSAAAAGAARALRKLHALLEDRGLALPLAYVPTAGLAAMARVAAEAGLEPGFADLLRRAASLGVLDARRARPRLTEREGVIARELASGRTVAQIAERLSVSPNTVKTQLRSLYRKLGASTRTEAVRALAASAVIPSEPPDGEEIREASA